MSARRARAFTLLEVIAVVLILGLVFLVMGGVFSQIAGTATDADQTETTRRGLLLIERVARDLEQGFDTRVRQSYIELSEQLSQPDEELVSFDIQGSINFHGSENSACKGRWQ